MANKPETQHEREHGSLLAAQEKRLLVWIAERLPQRVNSDHLSLLGLSGMLVAGVAFWAASWNSALLLGVVVALAINWFGDSLDGTVARVRDQQRPRAAAGLGVAFVVSASRNTAALYREEPLSVTPSRPRPAQLREPRRRTAVSLELPRVASPGLPHQQLAVVPHKASR